MSTAVVTPWKQLLLQAVEANSHLKHSSFFQLATIGADGRPANRTVVFRGFEEETDKIQINTDSRSHKISDIKHWPFAEICWYFAGSWEQFRINGYIDIIDESNSDPLKLQQREKAWFASSLNSRLQYLGPDPGLPSITEDLPKDIKLDPSAGPVSPFCLLVLDPDKVTLELKYLISITKLILMACLTFNLLAQVDYLNLKTNMRASFESSSLNGIKTWSREIINP